MKPENAIEVRDVTKKFKIYHDKGHMLKEKVLHLSRNKYEEHWVLNGISFEVKKGEAVGIIGHNGCGKSTTLKLLTRIMYPDSGTIEMSGRVSSLLELGAGFHPDMSGRENIYINASIFGLTKREIDRRVNDIIAFSELEEFIDNPVRTYSSGMYMRLAFSVAINVDADILLIDEILAVGDVNFASKCFNKLMEIKAQGTTIVLVSHSTAQIESICDRSIWIHEGLIRAEGTPIDVHREYINYMCSLRNKVVEDSQEEPMNQGAVQNPITDEIQMVADERSSEMDSEKKQEKSEENQSAVSVNAAKVMGADGKRKKVFFVGDRVDLAVDLFSVVSVADYNIEVNLVRADGLFCCGVSTETDCCTCKEWKGKKELALSFSSMNLLKGKYHFDLHVVSKNGSTILFQGNVAEFEVELLKPDRGFVYLEHEWMKL